MPLTPLIWKIEPPHARLFFLYLLGVGCFTVWQSIRLKLRLAALQKLIGTVPAKKATLTSSHGDGSSTADHKAADVQAFRPVQSAEREFSILYEMCDADVASINRSATLTFYLSLLVIVYGAFPTWTFEYTTSTLTGTAAWHKATEILLARLTLGLTMTTLVYAVSSFFAGALSRRKIKWRQLERLGDSSV
jgi:hypothetical protein